MQTYSTARREPIRRAEQAYEAIKRKIVSGALPSGARLDVNELVEEIQASRQPVLAAINRLTTEGFLRVVPQVGCWVASVEPEEVADFFRLFALTEGLASELAATRRESAQLDALHANLAMTMRLMERTDDSVAQSREFFRLNRDFHGLIHRMARSGYVAEQAGGMWDRCDFYLASAAPHIQGERIAESEREHEAIVEAIAAGQAKEASLLMRRHIQAFGEAAVRRLVVPA